MNCKYKTDKWKPNGCGPKGDGINKIIYYMIPNLIFKGACDCHDWAYFHGGCKLIDNSARYKADMEFKIHMDERIQTLYKWRRPLYRKLAKLYFAGVRSGGEKSFNWFDTPDEFREHLKKYSYI